MSTKPFTKQMLILCSFLVLLVFAGCDLNAMAITPTLAKTTQAANPSPKSEITFIPTLIPTLPHQILTATQNLPYVQNCLEASKEDFSLVDVADAGTLIVSKGITEPIYLLDVKAGKKYELPLIDTKSLLPLSGLDVSPNGEKLAYMEDIRDQAGDFIEGHLSVVDATGQVLTTQTINTQVMYSDWHWLDNDRLQLLFLQAKVNGTVALLNPFSHTWDYLTFKLPDFYSNFDLTPSYWLVDYNPDLVRVVYLGDIGEYGSGPIVRDVTTNQMIWQKAGAFAAVNVPSWSPSGDELAVIVDGQLYIIKRGSSEISLPELGSESEIMGFSWSPNEKYIVLLVRFNQPQINGHLMLYDVQAKRIIDYCIEDDKLNGRNLPIWSFDSQQFIYEKGNVEPILVDVSRNIAYRISDEEHILDWMK